ncbi:MAG: hypothetical protein LBC31_02155 [Treponema sp.]|jgi:hypothetical protein|nr:hypothetical protein [Treponema sp.]
MACEVSDGAIRIAIGMESFEMQFTVPVALSYTPISDNPLGFSAGAEYLYSSKAETASGSFLLKFILIWQPR